MFFFCTNFGVIWPLATWWDHIQHVPSLTLMLLFLSPIRSMSSKPPGTVFRCEAPGTKKGNKTKQTLPRGGAQKKKAQGFSRQANIEGFQKQNERGLEAKASSGNNTLIIQETHTHTHTPREIQTQTEGSKIKMKYMQCRMRNWKQDKTKQNRKAKQEGKKVEAKVPAKDGLMEHGHGDADQHKSIDRMRRQANTKTRNNTLDW